MVPGIGPEPGQDAAGRLFSYPDTHRYRIGPNYLQLPVNQPLVPVHSYNQDGPMNFRPGGDPVYAPNSYGGPQADPTWAEVTWEVPGAEIGGYAYEKHSGDDDFVQPRTLVNEVMSETDRDHLVTNIVGHASDGSRTRCSGE